MSYTLTWPTGFYTASPYPGVDVLWYATQALSGSGASELRLWAYDPSGSYPPEYNAVDDTGGIQCIQVPGSGGVFNLAALVSAIGGDQLVSGYFVGVDAPTFSVTQNPAVVGYGGADASVFADNNAAYSPGTSATLDANYYGLASYPNEATNPVTYAPGTQVHWKSLSCPVGMDIITSYKLGGFSFPGTYSVNYWQFYTNPARAARVGVSQPSYLHVSYQIWNSAISNSAPWANYPANTLYFIYNVAKDYGSAPPAGGTNGLNPANCRQRQMNFHGRFTLLGGSATFFGNYRAAPSPSWDIGPVTIAPAACVHGGYDPRATLLCNLTTSASPPALPLYQEWISVDDGHTWKQRTSGVPFQSTSYGVIQPRFVCGEDGSILRAAFALDAPTGGSQATTGRIIAVKTESGESLSTTAGQEYYFRDASGTSYATSVDLHFATSGYDLEKPGESGDRWFLSATPITGGVTEPGTVDYWSADGKCWHRIS